MVTLLEDAIGDKNNSENVSIAIRYVKDGMVHELCQDVYRYDASNFFINMKFRVHVC